MIGGGSLPGVLLGLALGSSAILLALERHQVISFGLSAIRQPLLLQQQARLVLFMLARDLRMHRQGGCSSLLLPSAAQGAEAQIAFMAPGWEIRQIRLDAEQKISALLLMPAMDVAPSGNEIVLSSCHHSERLAVPELPINPSQISGLLWWTPQGSLPGHHLPSLQAGPLVVRRYWLGRDAEGKSALLLSQNGQEDRVLLSPVQHFMVQDLGTDSIQIELLFGRENQPWRLQLAPPPRGFAQLMVMVLLLSAMSLLAMTQRLLLEEQRLQQQYEQWWKTLHYAEYSLLEAERMVQRGLGSQPAAVLFTPDCQHPAARVAWQKTGLCAPSADRQMRSAAAVRDLRLTPCHDASCIQLVLPHQKAHRSSLRGVAPRALDRISGIWFAPNTRTNHCPVNPEDGPFNPHPCFIVELLDPAYARGALYRITVRAWGWTTRSRVTLQSYYFAGPVPRRLSWIELP